MKLNKDHRIIVVGAGVFGLGASLSLRSRGYENITIVDASATTGPNPLASSTDISKIVRSDYGDDLEYTELNTEAIRRWKELNKKWGEDLYHETGLLVLSKSKMEPGSFAYNSYHTLLKSGYPLERLDAAAIKKRFPAWQENVYNDGYYNSKAGWAESGRVVGKWLEEAKSLGIKLISGQMKSLITENNQVKGIKLVSGEELKADFVLVAAGAWTPILLPKLTPMMKPVAQPVFHFQTDSSISAAKYTEPTFPTYVADIATTGYYGFPMHPTAKCLKIGHHGTGFPLPDQIVDKESLEVKLKQLVNAEEKRFRLFLKESLPELANSKAIYARLCLYCDSFDGNFFIGKDPEIAGLGVAAGGSGHGFKFSPVLGDVIADAMEGKETKYTKKFQWRMPPTDGTVRWDVARSVFKDRPPNAAM